MSASVLNLARAAGPETDGDAATREAIAQGDHRRAVMLLMDDHGPAILRYCERMLGDLDRARDVRQVVFVQAFQGMAGFSGRSSVRSWLFGIARHRCLDALKAARIRQHEALEEVVDGAEPSEASAEQAWAIHRVLVKCLGGLDVTVREVVLLRLQDGFSFPELQAMLGERAGTIQARVSRGAQRLRRCLEGHGVRP